MQATRKITEDLVYVGASDRRLALFENIFPISRGVSYNSYVLLDEKTVLFDTTDYSVGRQFFENVEYALAGRKLDYLVVNHMEPDHCALIEQVISKYPEVKIVGNVKTFQMMKQFFKFDVDKYSQAVSENDTLCVGKHTLTFVMAPMVHWPEAMVTFDMTDGVMFSADGFGTFGALNGNIFNDEIDFDRDFLDDARRYYTNIVGKYGVPVQNLLKKAAGLDIKIICPLHGPVWRTNLSYILGKYDKWSKYEAEEKGVVIVYASMYGNTENAANAAACKLAERGIKDIAVYDVSNTDVSEIISEMFKYTHIILAAPTYNGGIYPKMENLLSDMKALTVQNKKIAVIENGTWAATTGKQIKDIVSTLKNVEIIGDTITVKSALKDNQEKELEQLADSISADIGLI